MKLLFIDTAPCAFPARDAPWEPHCIRIAAIREDDGEVKEHLTFLIRPNPAWQMAESAVPYHRASPGNLTEYGAKVDVVASALIECGRGAGLIVSHNATFHNRMLASIFADSGMRDVMEAIPRYCTMTEAAPVCMLKLMSAERWKPPKLTEAYHFFTGAALTDWDRWDAFAEQQVKAVRAVYHGIQKRKA